MELEKLAAAGAEMPDGYNLPEQLLFLTLRELYHNFRSGAVNRERGHREKQRIMVAYKSLKASYELMEYHQRLRGRLAKEVGMLHKCGCETCRKFARVLDGIDRTDIPDDIRELHEWNEKLRDLVRERSERAAELATQLDRVRWALEKELPAEDIIEKIKEVVKK